MKDQTTQGRVWAVTNGIFPSNCYLCATDEAGECFIVDPGLDAAPIESALAAHGLKPRAVLCTHGHFDHTGSAAHFQNAYGCPVYLHERDLKTLRSSNFLMMACKVQARMQVPNPELVTDDQPLVTVGGCAIRFHPTPGHTPGSCAIEHAGSLFTGDTLYARGVGLSKLPGENADELRRSILKLWGMFPDETVIRPGHGESAALAWIKQNNLALRSFLQAEQVTLSAT